MRKTKLFYLKAGDDLKYVCRVFIAINKRQFESWYRLSVKHDHTTLTREKSGKIAKSLAFTLTHDRFQKYFADVFLPHNPSLPFAVHELYHAAFHLARKRGHKLEHTDLTFASPAIEQEELTAWILEHLVKEYVEKTQ